MGGVLQSMQDSVGYKRIHSYLRSVLTSHFPPIVSHYSPFFLSTGYGLKHTAVSEGNGGYRIIIHKYEAVWGEKGRAEPFTL